jgi:hypothetical protein
MEIINMCTKYNIYIAVTQFYNKKTRIKPFDINLNK